MYNYSKYSSIYVNCKALGRYISHPYDHGNNPVELINPVGIAALNVSFHEGLLLYRIGIIYITTLGSTV